MQKRAVVGGAGGFIGHHLVKYLKDRGYWVRGVDIKQPEYEATAADEFQLLDLRRWDNCLRPPRTSTRSTSWLPTWAASASSPRNHADDLAQQRADQRRTCSRRPARTASKRFLYTSSACIYPMYLQHEPDVTPLKEEDAYPADPEDGYGWEKLYSRAALPVLPRRLRPGDPGRALPQHLRPAGTYDGGREKAPAAICRKVALAERRRRDRDLGRRRADALLLLHRRLRRGHLPDHASDHREPLNLGTDRLITINELVDMVSRWPAKSW